MGIRNNTFALQLKAECCQILLQGQLLGRCYLGTMWVFIQITWSIPVSEQFNPYDSLHGEHSRAGTETGIQEPVAEVAPQAKGARSGLGQQGRVQNRSGACSLTGSPVGGFVWHERYSEVPHRSERRQN